MIREKTLPVECKLQKKTGKLRLWYIKTEICLFAAFYIIAIKLHCASVCCTSSSGLIRILVIPFILFL